MKYNVLKYTANRLWEMRAGNIASSPVCAGMPKYVPEEHWKLPFDTALQQGVPAAAYDVALQWFLERKPSFTSFLAYL